MSVVDAAVPVQDFYLAISFRPAHRETLPIPSGMTAGMVIGSGGHNIKQLRSIAPCAVIVEDDRVMIGTNSERNLRQLLEKLKQMLWQEHVSGPSRKYIHPNGVSDQGIYKFRPYRGRIPSRAQVTGLSMYELSLTLPEGGSHYEDDLAQGIASLNPMVEDTREGLQRQVRQLHGESLEEDLTWIQTTRVYIKPYEKISESLEAALTVLCDKRKEGPFVTRLDARFGKVTWSKFPEDVYGRSFSIHELVSLLFAKGGKHKNIFNTDVQGASGREIHTKLRKHPSHTTEIFDIKVTWLAQIGGEEGARLDIRLMINRGDDGSTSCKVVLVKKNEIKDITNDVLNLHRKHDFRIGLHHYKCVKDGEPLYGVVKELVGRMAFLSRHRVRFQPKTSRWNAHLIRHKQSKTYILDEGFAVAVTTVVEHSLDAETDEAIEFDLRMEKHEAHTEVELYNLAWECAFGRDAGLTPEQSLALHMEPGSVDARQFDTIPHPWDTASILRDFSTFWRHLEALVEMLEGAR